MQVTIIHTSDENVLVHKAGCDHIKRRGLNRRDYLSHYTTEVSSRQEAANDAWSDFIGESMNENDALGYTRFYPCAANLP